MDKETSKDETLGFIVLRHVNSIDTDKYWKHCYHCIRKHYPENWILMIDDNSDPSFLTYYPLYKVKIIQSEYPKRGELLPYLYYLKYPLFEMAIIIHDSVFIQHTYRDFKVHNYKILWNFEHTWDQVEDETSMIHLFKDDKLTEFYEDKTKWKGCFGGICIITHEYLTYIHGKYNLNLLIDKITSRYNRCSFERVIACILQIEGVEETMFGNIHNYCPYGINFYDKEYFKALPFLKVWTGR